MHSYDLNVILSAGLNDTQLEAEKAAVTAQVERSEGKIVSLEEWGSRRLAYPINKQSEGYYLIFKLELPLTAPKVIESGLRLRDNVMRALVTRDRPEWQTRKARKSQSAAQ